MIGNKGKFISLTTINGGKVTFGDKVVGKGKVGKMSHFLINDVSRRVKTQFIKHKLIL